MKINHNLSAIVANDNLMINEDRLTTSLERLSSGLKLNSAKDSPSGMAMSINMNAQIDGLNQASDNSQDGTSLLQTADGALNEVASMLQRMRELAIQAANGTNSLSDRESIQQEIDALAEEIDRISKDTEFNGTTIFDGSMDTKVYTDHAGVRVTDVTSHVAAGDYVIEIDAPATSATINGTGSVNETDNTPNQGVTGNITINGISVAVVETDSQAAIYMKIREAAESGGTDVTVEGGHYVFTADEPGADNTVSIVCDGDLATYLGLSLGEITAAGTDIRAHAVNGFRDTATIVGEGNVIKMTDKGGFEIIAKATDVAAGDQVNINVTGIGTMTLQVGANKGQTIDVKIPDMGAESLGVDHLNLLNEIGITKAIGKLDDAITKLSYVRSEIGAYENRLDYTFNSLEETIEDMTSALSRLTDVDMAEEMSTYTNLQVLTQAGTSVLAQANQVPQQTLQMLQ